MKTATGIFIGVAAFLVIIVLMIVMGGQKVFAGQAPPSTYPPTSAPQPPVSFSISIPVNNTNDPVSSANPSVTATGGQGGGPPQAQEGGGGGDILSTLGGLFGI